MSTVAKKRYCVSGTCRHAYCKGSREGGERGFIQGIAYTIAEIMRIDHPTLAAEIASSVGYTIKEYTNLGFVCEYDLKELRRLRRQERKFPRENGK